MKLMNNLDLPMLEGILRRDVLQVCAEKQAAITLINYARKEAKQRLGGKHILKFHNAVTFRSGRNALPFLS